MSSWDKEKIYDEYSSAVCYVEFQYGYQVLIDGRDMTAKLYGSELIYTDGERIIQGVTGGGGTAFFISEDGKLATNLHITRNWLFKNQSQLIKDDVDYIILTQIPILSRSLVEVKGVLTYIGIIPNGLPVTPSNLIECREIKGHNDTNIDVAVIQTISLKLPDQVTNIIDIDKADASEEAIKVGKNVYTIGFPYTLDLGVNSNMELTNQAQEGSVTQDQGEYSFGHNAATAGGASGSPILNDKGRLIGVHSAGTVEKQGFNSAIKVKHLLELLGK